MSSVKGVINPLTKVVADGWESNLGTLHRFGWKTEFFEDIARQSFNILFRNPTKRMVGRCSLDFLNVWDTYSPHGPLVYLDEQLLIKADMYREIEIPRVELFELHVGKPMMPIESLRGNSGEWKIYTSDAQETEIIVTPERVPMLLEEIRKAQMPRAKELIHSQHRREYRELETKAKILSFA